MSTAGSYVVENLVNEPLVHVANKDQARYWSDMVASGDLLPGEAVVVDAGVLDVPHGLGNRGRLRVAVGGDSATPDLFVATRTIENPRPGPDWTAVQTVNEPIKNREFVLAYSTIGLSMWTTLVVPDTYAIGDLIGWDADGVRPAGLNSAGGRTTGAWAKNSAADIKAVFRVVDLEKVNDSNETRLLLRGVK